MAPFFANQSCDPFLPVESPCNLGTYVQFAVNITGASDCQRTLDFVRQHNLRLTIRNTGHDYNGKATGAGALAVWTHHLKDIHIFDYASPYYTGKAMKLGAGVQGYEAYNAAHAEGLVIVGGNCPTVGIAGGYSQGGGHGPLASKYGLAADQVLEWEVVTGSNELLIATPSNNSDLYWALSGGGGGVFGIVLSMTSKVHTDMPSSASNLTFTSENITADEYYAAIGVFHSALLPLVDAGGVSIWEFTNETFTMAPTYGPNISKTEMNQFLKPVLDQLTDSGINHSYAVNEYPSFLESYNAMNPPIPTADLQIGGRWIPRTLVQTDNDALTQAFRAINQKGGGATGLALNASIDHRVIGAPSPLENSVNPGWRTTLFDMVIYLPYNYTSWSTDLSNQDLITKELIPELERLTPDGGAYLSEADPQQPNFQQTFYGPNYERLSTIKQKYDPDDLFYALTGVGSEHWVTRPDGRLCRFP